MTPKAILLSRFSPLERMLQGIFGLGLYILLVSGDMMAIP